MKQEGGGDVKYVCERQCQKCFETENLSCNAASVSTENEREKMSYGIPLNLVLLAHAPYMSHSQ